MSKTKRSVRLTKPLKWHGGKHYTAMWIIEQMPAHLHYVEPYAGGLSVLLQKPYEGISEVVNDLDGELMNFWSVLRDEACFQRFQMTIEATPMSESCWADSCAVNEEPDEVQLAVAFFVRYRQSRQGLGRDFATLSRRRTRRGMNEQASSWLTAVEGLPEIHKRLKRVVVLNRPALDVLKQQDGDDTLFYCDPPYLHETRSTTTEYGAYEMDELEHRKLLEALAGLRGKFLLSGYHSSLYDRWASGHGWTCAEKAIDNKASSAAVKSQKVECLWARA